MASQITENSESIDRRTSRSICDAVGERLQQNLRPERSELPAHLQHLLEEIRRQEQVWLRDAKSSYENTAIF